MDGAQGPTNRELAQTVERWQETQRQAAEDALRTSEALYHSLVETIPINVWRKDLNCRFTFANEGLCKALGRTLEEILGHTDFDLFPSELAQKYRHDDERVIATGNTFDETEPHVNGDGNKIYVRVIKLPIYNASKQIVGTQGTFWDVTETKRLEAVLQSTQLELEEVKKRLPG